MQKKICTQGVQGAVKVETGKGDVKGDATPHKSIDILKSLMMSKDLIKWSHDNDYPMVFGDLGTTEPNLDLSSMATKSLLESIIDRRTVSLFDQDRDQKLDSVDDYAAILTHFIKSEFM